MKLKQVDEIPDGRFVAIWETQYGIYSGTFQAENGVISEYSVHDDRFYPRTGEYLKTVGYESALYFTKEE